MTNHAANTRFPFTTIISRARTPALKLAELMKNAREARDKVVAPKFNEVPELFKPEWSSEAA